MIGPIEIEVREQDQRSFIMISVAANVPLFRVRSVLMKAVKNKRLRYSTGHINRLYKEYRDGLRFNSLDQRCITSANNAQCTATDVAHMEWLEHLMDMHRNWTQRGLALEMRISQSSVQRLLQNSGFKKVRARWIPHMLTVEEKAARVSAAKANKIWFENNPRMLGRIIAFDDTIWRNYLPLEVEQSAEYRKPGEDRPERIAQQLEGWSVHIMIVVRQNQIIATEFLDQKVKWTKERIVQFLNSTVKPYVDENMSGEPIVIEMDNAPWQRAGLVMQYLRDQNWTRLYHPAWSLVSL